MALALLLHRLHEQACSYGGSDGHQNIELERQRKSGHGGSGGHPGGQPGGAIKQQREQNTQAKPNPQDSGMALASTMPTMEGTCQASQLTEAAPQKKGTCSGAGRGSVKRFMKATKITSPLKYPIASRWRKGRCWK